MTVEGFRREMKELDVWPSNCLVAQDGDRAVAVLIGTKRQDEVAIRRVGVRPSHAGHGHGGHLVTSLSQKLAVLGPPRLVAEIPETLPRGVAFFETLGFEREARLVDRHRPAEPWPGPEPPAGLVIPVTAAELEADGALAGGLAWERRRETLLQRQGLQGLAVASFDRIEAWALFAEGDPVEVWWLGCRDPGRMETMLGVLLRAVAGGREVIIPRLAPGEVEPEVLEALGFTAGAETSRMVGEARAL